MDSAAQLGLRGRRDSVRESTIRFHSLRSDVALGAPQPLATSDRRSSFGVPLSLQPSMSATSPASSNGNALKSIRARLYANQGRRYGGGGRNRRNADGDSPADWPQLPAPYLTSS